MTLESGSYEALALPCSLGPLTRGGARAVRELRLEAGLRTAAPANPAWETLSQDHSAELLLNS